MLSLESDVLSLESEVLSVLSDTTELVSEAALLSELLLSEALLFLQPARVSVMIAASIAAEILFFMFFPFLVHSFPAVLFLCRSVTIDIIHYPSVKINEYCYKIV